MKKNKVINIKILLRQNNLVIVLLHILDGLKIINKLFTLSDINFRPNLRET